MITLFHQRFIQLFNKLFFKGLCARLALAFVALFLILGFVFLTLTHWSNGRYYQEVTQNLNKSLAMYIAQRAPLIEQGIVNKPAMTELATLVMTVNPIVEVYLLDTQGNILSHTLPTDSEFRQSVDIQPIKDVLENKRPFPILGQNPRANFEDQVFSAWPVTAPNKSSGATTNNNNKDSEKLEGYLYVILGGQNAQSLGDSVRGSYILQLSLAGLGIILLFATLSAILIFIVLTSPLRKLAQQMNNFQQQELKTSKKHTLNAPQQQITAGDEIAYLSATFNTMRTRIHEQMQTLEDTDRLRRELISNVSHDLRTPLASMQGYLEMLMRPATAPAERQQYIDIAFKHCRRLTQLVKELFELSKLDAGRVAPQLEDFSLAELLQDIVQKYSLTAAQKSITLTAPQSKNLFMVHADIALIERVFENLIDNALRYTPENGQVELTLTPSGKNINVAVKDTGIGLAAEDIPHIFDRYYRAQKNSECNQESTGLGLAIVKRILELHGSQIVVQSRLNEGTNFTFPLPAQRVAA